MPKTPRAPADLAILDSDLADYDGPLWRIARTSGPYVVPWNAGRTTGPLIGMRWDPHPLTPVPGMDAPGVIYASIQLAAAVAEVWQTTRRIDTVTDSPRLVRFTATRTLRLLDMTSTSVWSLRSGASATLPFAPKSTCRAWARAIYAARPALDGLLVPSTMVGTNVVLFPHGITSLPTAPDAAFDPNDPAVSAVLQAIATAINYRM